MNSPDIPEPPADTETPRPFHIAGAMYYPMGASVPLDQCICCGRPPVQTVSKALRHLSDIGSWYVKRPTVEVGLCKKHLESHRVALALTYSMLGLGVVFLIAGVFIWSFSMIIIGLVTTALCGVFRARETIQGAYVGDDTYQIYGAHPSFVERLTEHEIVEE